MSDPDDFTVGWICALATEYTAARAFLDQELPGIEHIPKNDNNEYTLGIIAQHHVVIALLPDGEYGCSPATGIATDMMRTFTDLRFVLMVGIGGGVPTAANPIRLGDVVVSRASDASSGVIQFDFGKIIQGHEFRPTRFLNQPPIFLRTAVNGLKARHESEGHHIQESIAQALDKKPRLRKKYSKPPVESDRLYNNTTLHPSENGTCLELCGTANDELVARSERDLNDDDPEIYYGVIASGNCLVKDAIVRDRLAEEMAVLCIETEAAGLMNRLPCLVIRGICDYADTHKNKDWQGYASMTAAAYAKELLGRVGMTKVRETNKLMVAMAEAGKQETLPSTQHLGKLSKSSVDMIGSSFREIPILQKQQLDYQKQSVIQNISSEHRQLLQTLKRCDYESSKNMNPFRAQGTCHWVHEHQDYLKWRKNIKESNLLWISADPGCGKSVLARAFIDDPAFSVSAETVITYFFFKDNVEQNNLAMALCSILHQLFSQLPEQLHLASHAWQIHGEQLCHDVNELWRIFLKATASFKAGPILCVLDALDECKDRDREKLLELLQDLHTNRMKQPSTSQTSVLKLIATSRPYSNIERKLDPIPEIRLRGEEEHEALRQEIDLVIHQKVEELAREFEMTEGDQQKLEMGLLRMEHRTYLWLHLAIDSIRRAYEESGNYAEEKINILPSSVQEAYEKMLSKIVISRNQKARNALGIIAGAQRALSVQELAYALGVVANEDTNELDAVAYRVNVKRWIRRACQLFVYFNNNKAYLIHQTAKEFLLGSEINQYNAWTWSFSGAEVQELMASICIKALISDDFDLHDETSDCEKSQFLRYCAQYWISHTSDAYERMLKHYRVQIDALHDISTRKCNAWFGIFRASRHDSYDIPQRMPKCHLCAFTGHTTWLERNIEIGDDDISATDATGHDALFWACYEGRLPSVKILLDKGADIEFSHSDDETALLVATSQGHIEVARMLLKRGADINGHGRLGIVSLHMALTSDRLDIAEMLLESGAEVNPHCKFFHLPLRMTKEISQHNTGNARVAYDRFAQKLIDRGARYDSDQDLQKP